MSDLPPDPPLPDPDEDDDDFPPTAPSDFPNDVPVPATASGGD